MLLSALIRKQYLLPAGLLLGAGVLAGCSALEPGYESDRRAAVKEVGKGLGLFAADGSVSAPDGRRNPAADPAGAVDPTVAASGLDLPSLDAAASAEDYLRFALLNHPRVHRAFYQWWSQVEAITPARSLPDPMLTFQADITDMIMSLMPGIMFDIPGWGMLEAMGNEAAAAADAAYREYVMALHETALQLRLAWAQLHYSDERLALGGQSAQMLEQSVMAAGADYGTGRGIGSLQMQAEQINTHGEALLRLDDLRDEVKLARARFKSALGLGYADADPYWPTAAYPAADALSADELWELALRANPRLEALRAMVQMAAAQVQVADKQGNPEFAAGVMADVKMNPVMFRPEVAMSLPIWRDKIAALLASAQAGAFAQQAALSEAELELATDLVQTLVMLRRSERMRAYLNDRALPNIDRALDSADAGYRSGSGDFGSLIALRLMRLRMQEELAMAQMERATALAELSMLTAAALPAEQLVVATDK